MSSSNSVKSPLQHMLSRAIKITNIRTYRDTEIQNALYFLEGTRAQISLVFLATRSWINNTLISNPISSEVKPSDK